MVYGVKINNGPSDWQIIAHTDGFADIFLSGTYKWETTSTKCKVYARIVLEDSGQAVAPWQECSIEGNTLEGQWQTTIKNIPTGGLYRIETCLNLDNQGIQWSKRGDMIHHIGIGDIYIIAGQSNAAGFGKDTIYDPPEIGVHILRNRGRWDLASHPLNESTNSIHPANIEGSNPGHSPYLHFAKILKRELNYPIGLLQSSLGGSQLSSWNPHEDGTLYRNMINIIKSQQGKIKGVLWYQGCSDNTTILSNNYYSRFENMVKNLRKDVCNNTLPILTVQLNRALNGSNEELDNCWGTVREAQRQAAKQIPHVYVTPASDCTLSDNIHNDAPSNMKLAERLAKIALTQIYGRNIFCKAPDINFATVNNSNEITLEFDNVYESLYMFVDIKNYSPFTILDDIGKVPITECIINNNKIVLKIDRKLTGNAVIHGAYERNPMMFLPFDSSTHLPMLSFYGVLIKFN